MRARSTANSIRLASLRRCAPSAASKLYFGIDELLRELSNPNLQHEIFSVSAYQVESWDRHAQHPITMYGFGHWR
jgi:hypothetical protein